MSLKLSNPTFGVGKILVEDVEVLSLVDSGIVGLGVSPSPWATGIGIRALDVANGGINASNNTTSIAHNTYFNSGFFYKSTGFAADYRLSEATGHHAWYTSPSGNAGEPITFTRAMTLTQTGNLLVGINGTFGSSRISVAGGDGITHLNDLAYNSSANSSLRLGLVQPAAVNSGAAFNYRISVEGDATGQQLRIVRNRRDIGESTVAAFSSAGNMLIGTPVDSGQQLQVRNATGSGTLSLAASTGSGGASAILMGNNDAGGVAGPNYILGANRELSFGVGNSFSGQGGTLTEYARITATGYSKASNTGTYRQIAGTYHEFYQTGNDPTLLLTPANTGAGARGCAVYAIAGFTGFHFEALLNESVVFRVAANGNVLNTNNSYGALSDVKLKENIVETSPKLDELTQVRIVNYTLKSNPDLKQIGVIAQELEEIFPGLVDSTPDVDEEGNDLGTVTKSVKYSVFVPILIKALQEETAARKSLEDRIAAIEAKLGQ